MNRAINSVVLTGLILCSAQAFADDSMTKATPTNHQMMKECIDKQKTSAVNMSKAEMKRICKDQLKNQKETGAMPSPPPADTPHD